MSPSGEKFRPRVPLWCFLAVISAVAAGAGAGAEIPARIEIVTEDVPPFNYVENGQVTGVSTEVVEAVLKEIGIEGHFTVLPWARAMSVAQAKPNILIYSINPTPVRLPLFKWVGVIASGNTVLYCLRSRPVSVDSLESVKNYRMGTILHDFRMEYFLANGWQVGRNLETASTQEMNYAKLKAGRIDLWPMDSSVMAYLVRKAGDDPDTMLKPLMTMDAQLGAGTFEAAFGLYSDDELVTRFREGLQRIKDKGIYDAILRKWRH